jgi:hypothetical protein
VISAVAFCPHPPVLVPDVAQGAAAELDDLRSACRAAIGASAGPGRRIVLLGPATEFASYGPRSRGSFSGFGLDLELALGQDAVDGPLELPLPLTVGAWLVRDALGPDTGAVAFSVTGAIPPELAALATGADDVGLVVMGDGSARRTLKAPGYLDDRAETFDRGLVAALAAGRPEALGALDPVLGADLLAAGVPVWRTVGALLATTEWHAEVLYDAAPYGVEYAVAAWTARG